MCKRIYPNPDGYGDKEIYTVEDCSNGEHHSFAFEKEAEDWIEENCPNKASFTSAEREEFFRKYHFEGGFDSPNFTQNDQRLILNKLEAVGLNGGFTPIPNGGIALLVISDKFTGKSEEERKSIVMNEIGNYKPKIIKRTHVFAWTPKEREAIKHPPEAQE